VENVPSLRWEWRERNSNGKYPLALDKDAVRIVLKITESATAIYFNHPNLIIKNRYGPETERRALF
jgi:hypothetical protein